MLLILGLYFFYTNLIFQPVKLESDYSFSFDLSFEELFLKGENGHFINAIYFKTNQTSKGVVLYLHGNADNLQRWASYHTDFTKRAYDILFIDYEGFGKSEGVPTEMALYSNAITAYEWLSQYYCEEDIVILGRSLGAAAATDLATKKACRFLVLETPFNSIRGAIEANLPFQYLPFDIDMKMNNDQKIPLIDCPIYIFHGTQDLIIPYRCASQLKPILKTKDEFITISNGGHKNLSEFDLYQEKMDQIFQ